MNVLLFPVLLGVSLAGISSAEELPRSEPPQAENQEEGNSRTQPMPDMYPVPPVIRTVPVPVPVSIPRPVSLPPRSTQIRPLGIERWIQAGDYPSRALRDGFEGDVDYRLSVGVNGRVASCTVVASSGMESLDDHTCRLLERRARFEPAMAAGEPVEGTFVGRIVWRLGSELADRQYSALPAPPVALTDYTPEVSDIPVDIGAISVGTPATDVRLAVDTDGKVTKCEVVDSSGMKAVDSASCEIALSRGEYEPARNLDGNPTEGMVVETIRWSVMDPNASEEEFAAPE